MAEQPSRRDVLKSLLIGGAALAFPKLAEAKPAPSGPDSFNRTNTPVPILPEAYRELSAHPEALQSFCARGLQVLDEIGFSGGGAYTAFEKLGAEQKRNIEHYLFEYIRLSAAFVRNVLIGQNAFDDGVAVGGLMRAQSALAGVGIHLATAPSLHRSISTVWNEGRGAHALHQLYQKFSTLASSSTKVPDKKVEKVNEKTGDAEKKKLPEGAYAFDQYGQPYGWKFQNKYQFFKSGETITFPDLVKPFAGKETNGHELDVQLRSDAFAAYTSLKADFEKTAPAHVREMGFFITEGFRTMEKQIALRKKLGSVAAHPGQSEHHLGTTIDIRNGKNEEMYHWLMGRPADWAKKDFVPRAIEHGFVPTVRIEPWHFRFVGKTAAEGYWHKLKAQIIDGHTRNLDRQWWGPNGELMKK